MDDDVQRLAILLVFQLLLLCTLENLDIYICVCYVFMTLATNVLRDGRGGGIEAGVCRAAKTYMGS